MKKKLYTFLACAAVSAMVLGGCGGTATEEPTTDTPAVEQEQEQTEEQAADENIVKDGSLPILSADLQKLYVDAQFIYDQINFGAFAVSEEDKMTANDLEYRKVVDERFDSYDAFKAYLETMFTADFVATKILNEGNIMFIKGEDGGLYTLGGGRGENIYYAGHVFEVEREVEKEIDFKATAYYVNGDKPYEGELFYTAPEKADDYTTQEFKFMLLNENGTWKFDEFALFY